jgi:hypothetical protein
VLNMNFDCKWAKIKQGGKESAIASNSRRTIGSLILKLL